MIGVVVIGSLSLTQLGESGSSSISNESSQQYPARVRLLGFSGLAAVIRIKMISNSISKIIRFNRSHTDARWKNAGTTFERASVQVRRQIEALRNSVSPGSDRYRWQAIVDGVTIRYNFRRFEDGLIFVGTMYPAR